MQSVLRLLCITTVVLFSLLSFVSLTVVAASNPYYLYHFCDNSTTFTINSTYQSNLNKLLHSLNSTNNNNAYSNGFYNATVGTGNSAVNGLFLCRGDESSSTCRDCVSYASTHVTNLCPVEKDVLVWYDECMFRYSNNTLYSQMSTSPTVYMWNTNNITASQLDNFNNVLSKTMNTLATEASSSRRRFAVEKANFTLFQSIFSLGQCTQDISESDCDSCLQQAITQIPSCCDSKQGGRVLTPSCNFRYEIYSFYNETVTAPPPPPPSPVALPPPPPPPTSTGGSGVSTAEIIAIVVPSSIAVLVLIICYFWRKKKAYHVTARDETSSKFSGKTQAWKHWRNGTTIELLDASLVNSYSRNEVNTCVHIALLSVQEDPADRPTMATIVLMLDSYSVTLPAPSQPAFFSETRTETINEFKPSESDQSTYSSIPVSIDASPITEVYPR
ncbi:hypothetical protein ACFE04_020331 [Oxalis oulophora]